jgi:hypothetical protein
VVIVAKRTVIGMVNSINWGMIRPVLRRKRRNPSQSSKIMLRLPKTLPMKIMIRKALKKSMKNLLYSPARYLEIIMGKWD